MPITMKTINFFTLLILALSFVSCRKEGCTNPLATNFNENATDSDNSCLFKGDVVFWFDENTSQNLGGTFGTENLNVYFDDELIGTYDVNNFQETAPDCSQQSTVGTEVDLGGETEESFNFRIEDDGGSIIEEGLVQVSASECTRRKITP